MDGFGVFLLLFIVKIIPFVFTENFACPQSDLSPVFRVIHKEKEVDF
jgi:hypothetical protein